MVSLNYLITVTAAELDRLKKRFMKLDRYALIVFTSS